MILSPAVRELLAIHEIFRRLGFLPQNLFVDLFERCSSPACQRPHAQFALRIGEPTTDPLFRIDINEDCANVKEDWPKAAAWWNSSERHRAELDEIYENSFTVKNKGALLMVMAEKGLLGPDTKEAIA